MTAKDVFVVAAVGAGLLLFWKSKEVVEKGIKYVDDVADAVIARPIAYIISKLILPPAIHINGGAVLPDGGYVSWDAITQAGSRLNAQQQFVWRGRTYKVTARRKDGNYDAIAA